MADAKKIIYEPSKMRLPVVIYASEELMPSERAIEQLCLIAKESSLEHAVIALPDIHDKPDNDFPTGIVAASRTKIFPQLLVSGVNCGMRLIKTPLFRNGLKETDIEALFDNLVNEIRTRGYASKPLSRDELFGILRKGASWIVENKGSDPEELEAIERKGNALEGEIDNERINSLIPGDILDIARVRLGFLGKGNHFLEMQKVTEVYDRILAEQFGLKEDQIVFLMHSGSGGFGSMVGHLYTPRPAFTKELKMNTFIFLQRLTSLFNKKRHKYMRYLSKYKVSKGELFGIEAESGLGRIYLDSISLAANFGYANRQYIATQLKNIISKRFSLQDSDIRTVYDMSHMSINNEAHQGIEMWVHRCGVTRAFSSSSLGPESRFKKTGLPIFLPGSMGDSTYICVSQDKNSETFFSVGHGSGRRRKEEIDMGSFTRRELVETLSAREIRLYKGLSKNIIEQHPRYFKDAKLTLDIYTNNGLVKPVLKTKPIAVLKG